MNTKSVCSWILTQNTLHRYIKRKFIREGNLIAHIRVHISLNILPYICNSYAHNMLWAGHTARGQANTLL